MEPFEPRRPQDPSWPILTAYGIAVALVIILACYGFVLLAATLATAAS